MLVLEAIGQRASVRSFQARAVDREVIEAILQAGWHAPCSCNLQLMRYVVVDDPDLQQQLAKVASKKVLWAPVNIFFFIDPRFNTRRHANIMGLGAAMQNMCLAAEAEGLASCPMAGFEGDDEIKRLLGVPDLYEAVLILAVGYPADSVVARDRQRLPLSRIADFNWFDVQKPPLNETEDLKKWSLGQLLDYRARIAPVYRYRDRFALQSYSRGIYARIHKQLLEAVPETDAVLDLCTYDGYFFTLLKNGEFARRHVATDYVSYTLTSLKDQHRDIATGLISERHTLDGVPDGSVSLVTCIHKLPFMPDPAGLLREAHRVLQSGGLLYITVPYQSWSALLRHRLNQAWQRALGHPANVYDGNPFYKIGPHMRVTLKQVMHDLAPLTFEVVQSERSGYKQELPKKHLYDTIILKK